MKRFKQFLEEHLIIQNLFEYGPPNPPSPYIPQPGSSDFDNYLPYGGQLPNLGYYGWQQAIQGGNSPEIPEWIITDENGNVLGFDLDLDGNQDTPEQLQHWVQHGLPPSTRYVDKNGFLRFIIAFWEVGQWVFPFGQTALLAEKTWLLARLLVHFVARGALLNDIVDIATLLRDIFQGSYDDYLDILTPEDIQAIQAYIQQIGPIDSVFFYNLIMYYFNSPTSPPNPDNVPLGSKIKTYYLRTPDGYQLYRWNAQTGRYEPFGPLLSHWDWLVQHAQCQQTGHCIKTFMDSSDIDFNHPIFMQPRPILIDPRTGDSGIFDNPNSQMSIQNNINTTGNNTSQN